MRCDHQAVEGQASEKLGIMRVREGGLQYNEKLKGEVRPAPAGCAHRQTQAGAQACQVSQGGTEVDQGVQQEEEATTGGSTASLGSPYIPERENHTVDEME